MPSYTVVNLLELPDSVGDRAPQIEGRFARGALESRDLGISHWRYEPGFQNSTGHKHGQQEEAYLVIGGSGRILLDGEATRDQAVGRRAGRARGGAGARGRTRRARVHRDRRPAAGGWGWGDGGGGVAGGVIFRLS